MEQLLVFLLTGAAAGVLAGLFGVGGGLIMVPALAWVIPQQGVSNEVAVHMAIGTSLAVIAATSVSSTLSHHRRGGVAWPVFAKFAPGLAAGALIGAYVADMLHGGALKRIIGVGALLVSVLMLLDLKPEASKPRQAPRGLELTAAGGVIGLLSSLIGIGGGSLTVPYLSSRGLGMRQVVGTAAAGGIPIAWGGAIGFIITGWGHPALPAWSLGYVSLSGFASLAIASVLTAPIGARLAHWMSPLLLKRAFALLLAVIGARMLLG